jgi:hypothetical protein
MDTPNGTGPINTNKVDDISNGLWLSPKEGLERGQWFTRDGKPISPTFINGISYGIMQRLIERRITLRRETSEQPEIYIDGTPFEGSNEKKQQIIAEMASYGEKLTFLYRHLCTMEYLRNNFVPYPYITRHATIQALDGIDTLITVDQFLQNYLIPAFKKSVPTSFNVDVIFNSSCLLQYQHDIVFKGDVNIICEEWIKKVIGNRSPESVIPGNHTLFVQENAMDSTSLDFKRIPFIRAVFTRIN